MVAKHSISRRQLIASADDSGGRVHFTATCTLLSPVFLLVLRARTQADRAPCTQRGLAQGKRGKCRG